MGFKKRKRVVPNFGMGGVPYGPISGERAPLKPSDVHPYCAMMQVAEEDQYQDYVVCRGFDPRIPAFIDYEEGDADKPGISVAKPFGNRIKCYYQIGQVFPAFLPIQGSEVYTPPSPEDVDWRVGQNPGTAVGSCVGQPQELDVTITELTDHNNKYVNWMLIDNGPMFLWVELRQNLYICSEALASILVVDSAGEWCSRCEHVMIEVADPHGIIAGNGLATGNPLYIPKRSRALVQRVMSSHPAIDSIPPQCEWAAVTFGSELCCESPSAPSPSALSPSSAACTLGECSWIWHEGAWVQYTDTCHFEPDCGCAAAPERDGDYKEEIVVGECEITP